jgi:hypothetical protein
MARVFLSYVREDADKARALAAILERSGHSVWWDRQIKGGAQYSTEIEVALDAAEKVVVLWSAKAVQSAWVRDEAAAGRDTGRLVPVHLDGTAPPLGFRQFQSIDLSHWNGRANAPQIKDLQEAIGASATVRSTAAERARFRPSRRLLTAGGAALAFAAAAAIGWQFWPASSSGTPTFAIVAADSSAAARQLASEVATRVAGLSDSSGTDFHVADASAVRGQNNYTLKVAASSTASTLSLVSRNAAIVWSSRIDMPEGSTSDVAQAAAITAQRVLSCAADVLSYRHESIDDATFKLYVQGCTQYDGAYGANDPNTALTKTFQSVISKAPHFAPAWSKLFAVEAEDVLQPDPGRDSLIKEIRSQLSRARQLGIDVAEAYAAEANTLSPADFIGIFRTYDEGIARHPESAFLFRQRGERSSFVGRMNDAVSDTGRAVQLDPLSPANHQSFASELAYSGSVDAGYEQLRKTERLWPNSLTVGMARYRMDLRFGDPKEAQQLYLKYGLQLGQNPASEKFIQARINPTPQNIEAALEAERKINRQFPPFIASLIQALGAFGRKDEAIDLLLNYPGGQYRDWIGFNAEVLFRPAMHDVWRDPRSMAGAAHVGLLAYWKKSGRWPDFCFDPTLPYDCKKEAAKYH